MGSKIEKTPAPRPPYLRWLYPLALGAMVVIASGRSQVAAPGVAGIDKLGHFSVFGLLATLVIRSPGMRQWWGAIVVVSFFGISDELHQSFTPGRAVEFADWVADTLGATCAICLYVFWPNYRRLLETALPRPAWFRARHRPIEGSVSAPKEAFSES
ncbi:MAG: hypothetical protein RL376_1226 [Verrucomicrobiota bacterium]|jgi:VanZ family protein